MDFHGEGITDGWENPYLIATLATQHGCVLWSLLARLSPIFGRSEKGIHGGFMRMEIECY